MWIETVDNRNDTLPSAERDELIDRTAKEVVRRGLQSAAIFALEIHKPLAFVAAQSLIVATPLIGPLIGLNRMQQWSRLLGEPGNVELLIRRIEELSVVDMAGSSEPGHSAEVFR